MILVPLDLARLGAHHGLGVGEHGLELGPEPVDVKVAEQHDDPRRAEPQRVERLVLVDRDRGRRDVDELRPSRAV